ncbi:MAG: hypothetical protein IKP86_02860 [Anaerolineaceae bacterium]|nr:hypothetical protein [Anaerolineaceae bacterium]
MEKPEDRDIEQFPEEKKQLHDNEPPELIFFDVDGVPEEADFIRVDDLFRTEGAAENLLTGILSFTLFPQKTGTLIGSRLSRLIHRTLAVSAARQQHPLRKVRIRPRFVQWQLELGDGDDPAELAGEFRNDLELQFRVFTDTPDHVRYWSNNCFVCPFDKELTDEAIVRIAESYQIKEAGT